MRYKTAAALILALLSGPALAHEAYDYRCCGERDCGPIDDKYVFETPEAVTFRIPPGAHPMWPADKPNFLVVEIARVRIEHRRLDGRWHVCINGVFDVLCAYPPERGY